MATAVSAPQDDLERGLGPNTTRATGYIRDITYRVIPFCMAVLIIFSVGIIVVSTLHFDQPVPHEGTFVISILLAVLFFLFCIGIAYLYKKKHYPPLTKGPDASDRLSETRTWKSLFPRASRLFAGHLTADKVLHHQTKPIVVIQGATNGPAELESPNPAGMPPPETLRPRGPRAMERPATLWPSDAERSEAPVHRRPVPGHGRQRHQSPHPRASFSPSGESILEEPEEDESVHSVPVMSATYIPSAQHPSNARDAGRAGRDEDMVSPKTQYLAPPPNTGVSPSHPRFQTTSPNGSPQVHRRGSQHPVTPPNPQTPVNTGRSQDRFTPGMRPTPSVFRLSLDSPDPLANFAHIPEYANEQVFDDILREKPAENGLYIFKDLSNLSNQELEAGEFGGECRCREKPRSRVQKRKAKATQSHVDILQKSLAHDSGYSDGIFSFNDSSVARPTQVVYPPEPRAKRSGVITSAQGKENGWSSKGTAEKKRGPKRTTRPSTPFHPHPERQGHSPSKRRHRSPVQQNGTRSKMSRSPDTSLYPLPLNLPSAPPKTKSPTRKYPEILDALAGKGKAKRAGSIIGGCHEIESEVGEKPLDPKRDRR
ncbi:hypothetical protein F5Y05DRAFT_425083 [Hypoxylon sp. FL0543]|nr:hypothetical protein F5Y05DRAFT_425083 [Hypoxylon sp. FL0543]